MCSDFYPVENACFSAFFRYFTDPKETRMAKKISCFYPIGDRYPPSFPVAGI